MAVPGRTRFAAAAVLLAFAAGCSQQGFSGVYELPLPGGADLGEHPYRVTVSFRNALDLVPHSAVKVKDVSVGVVEKVALAPDGRTARITMVVRGGVRLPANAVARIRQTSVLGEKFIDLDAPEVVSPRGRLADGAVIPVERTNRNPEIEEVFGALSLLLNGGGVAQISNITRELNSALGGNEDSARALISNLDTFMRGLDEHRGEITRALDSVNKLAATLEHRKAQIDTVLTDLTPGIEALSKQRRALTRMLTSLADLTDVAVHTVNRSKDDLVADLRTLEPTLRRLADSGAALPKAMETLLTFPFPDAALDGIKGDYLNAYVHLDAKTSGAAADAPAGGAPRLPLPSAGSGPMTIAGGDG